MIEMNQTKYSFVIFKRLSNLHFYIWDIRNHCWNRAKIAYVATTSSINISTFKSISMIVLKVKSNSFEPRFISKHSIINLFVSKIKSRLGLGSSISFIRWFYYFWIRTWFITRMRSLVAKTLWNLGKWPIWWVMQQLRPFLVNFVSSHIHCKRGRYHYAD